jgi:homoserine dehydrogenase
VFVAPVLVQRDDILASIDGATNAVCFAGRSSSGGRGERDYDYVLVGPGAGGGPTAVAVLGDVYELARGGRKLAGVPSLIPPGTLRLQAEDEINGSFYLRLVVKDRAGIVGDIGRTFGQIGINISEIWQMRHTEEEVRLLAQSYKLRQRLRDVLPFVMTLERATVRQMRKALDSLGQRDYIVVDPVWFPIWGAK